MGKVSILGRVKSIYGIKSLFQKFNWYIVAWLLDAAIFFLLEYFLKKPLLETLFKMLCYT